jgi:hypothetical protein
MGKKFNFGYLEEVNNMYNKPKNRFTIRIKFGISVLFILVAFLVISIAAYEKQAYTYRIKDIHQMTYYTNDIKESNGCVYFNVQYGSDMVEKSLCGTYSIDKLK